MAFLKNYQPDISANGNFTISVDKNFAKIGDILTYTIEVINKSNIDANNVIISNLLEFSNSFVLDSVKVNNLPLTNVNPGNGINLGTIAKTSTLTVSFKVKVDKVPSDNIIANRATITYTYTKDSNLPNSELVSCFTNTVYTEVKTANLASDGNFIHYSDKSFSYLGDIITYTLLVKNTGNTMASNLILNIPLPEEVTFVDKSFTIDNVVQPNINLNNNIYIGSLSPNFTANISFKVKVIDIPKNNILSSKALIKWNFTVNPEKINEENLSNESNLVTVIINEANLFSSDKVAKSVDKTLANVGDDLTYELLLENKGNVAANNVTVKDLIPSECSFIAKSLFINNQLNSSYNPLIGISLGTISPGEKINLAYKVKIDKLPLDTNLNSFSNINFDYLVNPNSGSSTSVNINSNSVTTKVASVDFLGKNNENFMVFTDKSYADINDLITYKINIVNSGNIGANNVILKALDKGNIIFQGGSISINGVKVSDLLNSNEINLGDININEAVTIEFKAKVLAIPLEGNIIESQFALLYNYEGKALLNNKNSLEVKSNIVTIIVNNGNIPKHKAFAFTDKTLTSIGDEVTFYFKGTNVGNTTIIDLLIEDIFPLAVTPITDSIILNGVPSSNNHNNFNFTIPTVKANETVEFSVKATVNNDAPPMLVSKPKISYKYLVNPNDSLKEGTVTTDKIILSVLKPSLELTQKTDKIGTYIGDIVKYTIIAKNSGELKLTDVIIKNNESSFNGALTLNDEAIEGDITRGINIGNLDIGQRAIISFDSKVQPLNREKELKSKSLATFNYNVNLSNNNLKATSISNESILKLFTASVLFAKEVNDNFIKIDSQFKYIIRATNTGELNISNATIKDILPPQMIVEQLKLNGQVIEDSLSTGINIGTLKIGESKKLEVTVRILSILEGDIPYVDKAIGVFEILIDSNNEPLKIFKEASLSNKLNIFNYKLTLLKTSSKEYAAVGDILTYSIKVTNDGISSLNGLPLKDIVITDVLPNELKFLPGSLKINNATKAKENIIDGVNIGDLALGKSKIISFDAEVISFNSKEIINRAKAEFKYLIAPNENFKTGYSKSNDAIVNIKNVNLKLIKEADLEVVSLFNILTYNVTLINDGDLDLFDVVFQDLLSKNLEFIEDSFYLFNRQLDNVNLNKGVNLGIIPSDESLTVSFKVRVVGSNYNNKIENQSSAKFNYNFIDNSLGHKVVKSNLLITDISLPTFKEISINKEIELPYQRPNFNIINSLDGNIELLNSEVIKTAIITSPLNQNLTGYKLIIHSLLKIIINYSSNNSEYSLQSVAYSIPFSSFIILPPDYNQRSIVDIKQDLIALNFIQLTDRKLLLNSSIFAYVKIK